MGRNENPILGLFKKMWRYSEKKFKVVLFVSMFVIANLINFLEPLLVAKILNIAQEQGINQASMPTLILYAAGFIVLSAGFWAFHGPARVIELKNAFLVRANYKKYLLDGVMNLPASWHTDHHSGDTFDKIEKASESLLMFSKRNFEVIETVVRSISSFFALAFFNIHSVYIIILMVFITITLILRFDAVLVKRYIKIYKANNKISAKIFDTLSNITTVIILRIEKLLSKSIFKKIMHPLKLTDKTNKINEIKWFLVSLCSATMIFLVIASYIFFNVRAGNVVLVGTLYALYGYVSRISGLFYRFAYRYGDMVRWHTAIVNAEEISNEFKDIKKHKPISLKFKWREMKIENLNFTYPDETGNKLHLDNVNMIFYKNEKIAVIGESGSGKTTLLKIMRDLYSPKKINIYIDEHPLKNGFKSISSDIALIPQDPEIFSTTIKENITMGINHKMKYIKKYTDLARFTRVVKKLPNKFDSFIYEKGVNLSGGEKQRLALSRGLIACEDKSIVLLDEATSSVDLENEFEIYQNIFKEFKDKTIIASIHRLHLLPLFDRIYYFKDGKVISSGSFEEMMKDSKEFKKLWKKYNENMMKRRP